MTAGVKTHQFLWNGDPADHKDCRYCTCGLPKTNASHDVPDQTPEAAELDARTLGEHQEE